MKWKTFFKADACVELEADVPADPCDQPGIAQASLVDFDRHALVCGALWDWIFWIIRCLASRLSMGKRVNIHDDG